MKDPRNPGPVPLAREPVTVTLPVDLVRTLKDFCREYRVEADIVAERALIEYFREGDMSH